MSATAAEELLTTRNVPTVVNATVNIGLVRSGDRLALLDSGLGGVPFGASIANRLVPTLAALGIGADAITDVILSHFHADHIGGLVNLADGSLVFPNAAVHIPAIELDLVNNAPSGTPLDDQFNLAKGNLAAAGDRMATYDADAEIIAGVTSIAAPGHTPGHYAFRLSSGDAQLVATSDTANHPILALANPSWYFGFDYAPDQAVETRTSVFGMLADDQSQIFAYHFPFPGIGYIARAGEGFSYTPSEA